MNIFLNILLGILCVLFIAEIWDIPAKILRKIKELKNKQKRKEE